MVEETHEKMLYELLKLLLQHNSLNIHLYAQYIRNTLSPLT